MRENIMDEQNESKITRNDFNGLLYEVITDEIIRLRKAKSRKERDNIREFLLKVFGVSRNY